MNRKKKRYKTTFGDLNENNKGYFRLSDNTLLHRKVWEEYYGQKIPKGYVIHHKDENPKNNSIENLQLMTVEEHIKHHHKGKTVSDTSRELISKSTNKTGYFRVSKKACAKCKKGFVYRYQWYKENGEKMAITSTDLKKLRQKVLQKGLTWKRL